MATKTAKAPRRKKKAGSTRAAAPEAGEDASGPKKRGRKANVWIEGMSPQTFKDYREKYGISEAKLAKYLGTTLTSYRNWVANKNRPSAANQERYRELLSKPYEAPPEGEKRPRGRPKAEGAPAMTTSVAAARSAVAARNGDEAHAVLSSAVAEVVAAYVRRLPADQPLSIEDLERITARIRLMLS